jgi:hypothetical protein
LAEVIRNKTINQFFIDESGDDYRKYAALDIYYSFYFINYVPCVEAGSNTSTVTLRVVGGDERGSLKSETVKYGLESQETQTRERLHWQGPAA